MKTILANFAIFFSFYILGAYATTDILRLLKGSTVPVNAKDCYCPKCHNKIALKDQLPVFSYLKNHGACAFCQSPIPVSDLFLEIFLFGMLSLITLVFRFHWTGYFVCISFYEGVKIVFLFLFGKRETAFFKNLAVSLLHNLFLFGILAFFFALAQI